MTRPPIRLGQQNAVDDQRGHIAMCVPHQDHVDAGDLSRDCNCRIFIRHLRRIGLARAQVFFDAHVHRDCHYINRFFIAQNRHPLFRFADTFVELEPGIVRHIFPIGNAGGRQTQHANARALDFFHNIRLVMRRRRSLVISIRR